MFQHHNIRKFTYISPDRLKIKLIIFYLIEDSIKLHLISDHSGQQVLILTTICWW
jgi:hypothetical protein